MSESKHVTLKLELEGTLPEEVAGQLVAMCLKVCPAGGKLAVVSNDGASEMTFRSMVDDAMQGLVNHVAVTPGGVKLTYAPKLARAPTASADGIVMINGVAATAKQLEGLNQLLNMLNMTAPLAGEVPTRGINMMISRDIFYLAHVAKKTRKELDDIDNVGGKALRGMDRVLAHFDLDYGMEITGWQPPV